MKKTRTLFPKIDFHKLLPHSLEKGAVPGKVAYVGRARKKDIKISVIEYDEEVYEEKEISSNDLGKYVDTPRVSWINVSGVHDTKLVQSVGELFGIHPLVLEDISNTTQRPKFEEHDEYVFVTLKMLYLDENQELIVEQISIVTGKNWVLSFQETEQDILHPLRDRIRNKKGRIRKQKNDYLTFAIIDSIVDHYFHVAEAIGEKVEQIEEEVLNNPNQQVQSSIYQLKRHLIYVKKFLWPTRELTHQIFQSEHKLFQKKTRNYFRDIHDHTIQIIESLEGLREIVSGMMDLYLSSVSNKTNEVMKMLTVFASIFIPLTFITGIYGMNFEYMPELSWEWGYFGVWGFMVAVTAGLFVYFKVKKWF